MTQKPLVSFVIRTKNEQRTIGKVLKALACQTFQDFEIFLVDNNSKDKTLAIAKKFARKLPIQIIKLKPGEFNYSYAINIGATRARGKYLCVLNGHCLPINITWLANGLKEFQKSKVAAVTGHYSENPLGFFLPTLGRFLFKLHQNKREEFTPWLTNTNALIKKKLWQKYPFDEKLDGCEDYDWALEMLARGYNIIKTPKFNVFHSHFVLGQRLNYFTKWQKWKKTCAQINKRKRPRHSYTRLKT